MQHLRTKQKEISIAILIKSKVISFSGSQDFRNNLYGHHTKNSLDNQARMGISPIYPAWILFIKKPNSMLGWSPPVSESYPKQRYSQHGDPPKKKKYSTRNILVCKGIRNNAAHALWQIEIDNHDHASLQKLLFVVHMVRLLRRINKKREF